MALAVCLSGLIWLDQASRADDDGPLSGLRALELGAPESLGRWFTSLLLLAAAAGSLVVYTLRRHRTDDYQGRYRVWLWASGCYVLLAADTAAPLDAVARAMMLHWTGTPLWGNGDAWWLGAGGLLFGAVGSRLLVDLWECRSAALCLVAAAACALVSLAVGQGWIGPPGDIAAFGPAAGMCGAAMSLLAVLLNGRYVRLDAEGSLEHPTVDADTPRSAPAACNNDADAAPGETGGDQAASAGASTRSTDDADEGWVRVEAAHGRPQPVLRRGAPGSASVATQPAVSGGATGTRSGATQAGASGGSDSSSVSSTTAQPTVNRKLTKAEKKALRERLLAARLQRQQPSSRW